MMSMGLQPYNAAPAGVGEVDERAVNHDILNAIRRLSNTSNVVAVSVLDVGELPPKNGRQES
jgi:hypothetical protein